MYNDPSCPSSSKSLGFDQNEDQWANKQSTHTAPPPEFHRKNEQKEICI